MRMSHQKLELGPYHNYDDNFSSSVSILFVEGELRCSIASQYYKELS